MNNENMVNEFHQEKDEISIEEKIETLMDMCNRIDKMTTLLPELIKDIK